MEILTGRHFIEPIVTRRSCTFWLCGVFNEVFHYKKYIVQGLTDPYRA